jgi:hypothetical protein
MTREHNRQRPPRGSRRRAVYFVGTCGIASACLLVLFVWPIFDASYRYASWLARVNLGLERIVAADPIVDDIGVTGQMLKMANSWDQLGSRVAILYVIESLGLIATGLLIVTCVRSRSIGRVLAAVVVLGGWFALFASQRRIDEWSTRRRVEHLLPRVEAAAALLQSHWPTRSGQIGPDLRIVMSDRHPNTLIVVGRRSYPFDEDIGYQIDRSPNGTIRFKLAGAFDYELELHAAGSLPAVSVDEFGHQSAPVARADRLDAGWYLVRYAGG